MRLAISMVGVLCALSGAAMGQVNDNCENAIPLNLGATLVLVNGTTANATADGSCSCAQSAKDVWYSVTPATDRFLVVDTCLGQGNSFDTVVSIHSGCPGTAANQIACNDDQCERLSSVFANVQAGHTYLIRVSGFANNAGPFLMEAALQDPPVGRTPGPDLVLGDIPDMQCFGRVGDIAAYSIGSNVCNIGDTPATWIRLTNQHPVLAQNMYRFTSTGGGRIEQIGQSWLKHGLFTNNSNFCRECIQPPGGESQLGIGCSDVYAAITNGTPAFLGPRSEVNATTGEFPFPFSSPLDESAIGGRLQVRFSDVDPLQNPGGRYFVEGQLVTFDDATATVGGRHGNGLNNASWRALDMSNPLATSIPVLGGTVEQQQAIFVWKEIDPSVTIANADYAEGDITAMFLVGGQVTPNAGGTWTYEYAVYNLNSDRSGGSFSVPLPPGAVVSNVGFHGVFSHSGEPFENTVDNPADWRATVANGAITWTPEHSFDENVNANALRWGTMYNFRFTTNAPPQPVGVATIGLFKPASAVSPAIRVTGAVPTPLTFSCGSADFNGDGDVGTDADINAFFACLGGNCCASCGSADFNRDGDTGTDADIEAFFRVLGGGSC